MSAISADLVHIRILHAELKGCTVGVHEDVYMAVGCSQIFDGVDRPVDEELCPEGKACHGDGVSCPRHDAGSRRLVGAAAAPCARAVSGQLELAKIFSAGTALRGLR